MMSKKKKILIILGVLFILGASLVFGINAYVIASSKDYIVEEAYAYDMEDVDCILVLGAFVKNGSPSPMLKDRLETGVALYENGAAPKVIVSGDHGKTNYDEVNTMKNYMIGDDIPSEDIFMDHAGFSTYDSVYRAKEIFGAKKIIIVTQEYHLYRALYIAKSLGIEAYGVRAVPNKYRGQLKREIREILARDKDFVKSLLKPQASIMGDTIPVSGNGDVTNDKDAQSM